MNSTEHLPGKFRLTDGREVFGILFISGKDSKLTLLDDIPFNFYDPEIYVYIVGELYDGRVVTLLHCILLEIELAGGILDKEKYAAQLFPHYVTLGSSSVSQFAPCISQISFAMRDASALFYDFDAFSIVLNPKPFIPQLQNDKATIRQINIGERPIIAYFTGMLDIAIVETVLGTVKAHHMPRYGLGGPQGIRIDNKVMLTLIPTQPLTFQNGLNSLSDLLRFFELILGREQLLDELEMMLCSQDDSSSGVKLYRSLSADQYKRVNCEEPRSLGPRDALISIISNSTEQYSTVLANYLESDRERHDSRMRLRSALNSGHHYTIDRIIAAANIFDIFPDSAYPNKEILSEDLAAAKSKARDLFKPLPESFERSSILGAIGRIGKLSLKHKIRHRITSTGLDNHFPQLIKVVEEAVNCRNHYVHGSLGRVDYSKNFDLVVFLTDSLEFSFAISDIIEMGLDITYLKRGCEHRFGQFIIGYQAKLEYFNKLINSEI